MGNILKTTVDGEDYYYLEHASGARFFDDMSFTKRPAHETLSEHYEVVKWWYNVERGLLIKIISSDSHPIEHSNHLLTDMIKNATTNPRWAMITSNQAQIPFLIQSKIRKNCFMASRLANSKVIEGPLVAVLLNCLEVKAHHFGLDITIKYTKNKFPVVCNTEEDLAMFSIYFQDFL